MRYFLLIVFALLISVSLTFADDRGPFKGKVIDADTKEPLEGVVVVVTWIKRMDLPNATYQRLAKAKEALTDSKGEFFISKFKYFSLNPMWKLEKPEFLVFKPSYAIYPNRLSMLSPLHPKVKPRFSETIKGWMKDPPWYPLYRLKEIEYFSDYAIIELPKLETEEERKDNIAEALMFPSGDKELYEVLKEFKRLLNEERINVGLEPFE